MVHPGPWFIPWSIPCCAGCCMRSQSRHVFSPQQTPVTPPAGPRAHCAGSTQTQTQHLHEPLNANKCQQGGPHAECMHAVWKKRAHAQNTQHTRHTHTHTHTHTPTQGKQVAARWQRGVVAAPWSCGIRRWPLVHPLGSSPAAPCCMMIVRTPACGMRSMPPHQLAGDTGDL
jgi:hypothetical protein